MSRSNKLLKYTLTEAPDEEDHTYEDREGYRLQLGKVETSKNMAMENIRIRKGEQAKGTGKDDKGKGKGLGKPGKDTDNDKGKQDKGNAHDAWSRQPDSKRVRQSLDDNDRLVGVIDALTTELQTARARTNAPNNEQLPRSSVPCVQPQVMLDVEKAKLMLARLERCRHAYMSMHAVAITPRAGVH